MRKSKREEEEWLKSLRWQLREVDTADIIQRYMAAKGKKVKNFPAWEICQALALLVYVRGLKRAEAAQLFDKKSDTWPQSYLFLLEFPEEVQAMFSSRFPARVRLQAADILSIKRSRPEDRVRVAQALQSDRSRGKRDVFTNVNEQYKK